jgi:hypothetical protein
MLISFHACYLGRRKGKKRKAKNSGAGEKIFTRVWSRKKPWPKINAMIISTVNKGRRQKFNYISTCVVIFSAIQISNSFFKKNSLYM